MEAHHVKSWAEYPKLRYQMNNGITFCKECHKEFHKIYGRKNNTREQLEEFLKIKDQNQNQITQLKINNLKCFVPLRKFEHF